MRTLHVHWLKIWIGYRTQMFVMTTSSTLRRIVIRLKSRGKERQSIASIFLVVVRTTALIATSRFLEMSTTWRAKFYRARWWITSWVSWEWRWKLFPKVARIKVDDDTSFAFGDAWMEEFLERYQENPLYLLNACSFRCFSKIWFVNWWQPVLRVQTIESASPEESVEFHNRSADKSIWILRKPIRMGLNIVYDVIIDNPHATEKMKLETQ